MNSMMGQSHRSRNEGTTKPSSAAAVRVRPDGVAIAPGNPRSLDASPAP